MEFHDLLFTGGGLPAAVPEPSTLVLCGAGLVLAGVTRRRRS
jgi:hypothetical protein